MTRLKRFVIKKHDGDNTVAYSVQDMDAAKYHMPEQVGIYFREQITALKVSEILNDEWVAFLNNPY